MRKLMGQEQKDCFGMKAAAKLTMSELLRIPSVPTLLAIYFLVMLSFNFFYVSFPVFAVGTLGWSLTETGISFAVMGLLMVGVQGPVLGRVSGFVSEKALIVIGGFTLALGFRLFDATTDAGMYLAVALMALGNGLMWPSALSVLSKAAGDTYSGSGSGSRREPWCDREHRRADRRRRPLRDHRTHYLLGVGGSHPAGRRRRRLPAGVAGVRMNLVSRSHSFAIEPARL